MPADSHSTVEQFSVAQSSFTTRPIIMSRKGLATSGHYLATAIGGDILRHGGNAFDAGVAMGLALTVIEPHMNGIAGEVPMLIYSARDDHVFAISGQGWAPKGMTISWFREHGIDMIPGDGLLPAMVPGSLDAWIRVLAQFGRLKLADVLGPAVELARNGFPMYPGLSRAIASCADRFRMEWPTSAEVYLPDDRPPQVAENFCQHAWADTFQKLLDVESANSHLGREAAMFAARDVFYRGEIAQQIAEFAQTSEFMDASGAAHSGFITREDLAEYEGAIEEPVTTTFRGLQVYKCGPWCQGPVFLQLLSLLEASDLKGMGHNSPDYIHTWIECAKIAYGDRERWYGDPRFSDIPLERLLSKEYAAEARAGLNPTKASHEPIPGPESYQGPQGMGLGTGFGHDTTQLDAIDSEGNMIAATPSGGWIPSSPVIPGLGFPLGTRGQMFVLVEGHPNSLEPGKRPRTTLTPSLATKEGRPFMVFGTPGGDQQDQWTNQFFLNFVEFNMDVQAALDAPTFHSLHFPGSFYPRTAKPGHMVAEARIADATIKALSSRGHIVHVSDGWSHGRCLAIWRDESTGTILGGASPRLGTGYAIGV